MGGDETELLSLAATVTQRYFVLSLRAPIAIAGGGHSWYDVRFAPTPVIDGAQAETSRLLVIEFLEEAVQHYGLEPDSVFLAGFSQGAIVAASVALTRPDIVAGLVMMSGRIPPELKAQVASLEPLRDLSVFVTHGRDDQRLPIVNAIETRDWLEILGVKLTYQEYASGHEVSVEQQRDVAQWLLEKF